MGHPADPRAAIDAIYRRESRRVLATLIRLLGDFDLAEAALHDAFATAVARWPEAGIPYQVPPLSELHERLDAVLQVIYLVFNEGYSASSGTSLTRHDLSAEAIRLGRLLVELLPEAEATGLLALMLLHDARRSARESSDG